MMLICRALIIFSLFLLISSPCRGDISSLREYILARNASGDILAKALNMKAPYEGCTQTVSHLICIHAGIYPNIANNQIAKTGILKNLLISARHLLYMKALAKYSDSPFINQEIQNFVFLSAQNNRESPLLLRGVESAVFNQNDWCAAVASIKISSVSNDINKIFKKPEFIKEYCKSSLATARKLMTESKYEEALSLLKELHALQPHDIDVCMNTAEALYMAKRLNESEKIAIRILSDYSTEMSENQLMKLNELFNNLEISRYEQK